MNAVISRECVFSRTRPPLISFNFVYRVDLLIRQLMIILSTIILTTSVFTSIGTQVWFQNRRAKFRKQERIAQQKVTSNSNSSAEHHQPSANNNVKMELKGGQGGGGGGGGGGDATPIKDMIKPSSPMSTVSTTPNSNASSNPSDSHHIKSLNGKY